MEGIEYHVRLALKIRLRVYRLFLGWPAVLEHENLNDHKHTKNHPEQGPRQKVAYPAGSDEILQFSDGIHHSIVTEAKRGKVKASVRERKAYKCVKTAVVYFVAGRITLWIFCVTTARRFTVIRIVADDNDALVGALGSELASSTSGECVAVGTRRVRWDVWTSRVQGHHRGSPNGSRKVACSASVTRWGSR